MHIIFIFMCLYLYVGPGKISGLICAWCLIYTMLSCWSTAGCMTFMSLLVRSHTVSYWHCWGIGPPQTADAFCQIIKRSQTLNWLKSVIIVLSPGSPCILFKPHSVLRSVGFATTDISLGSCISEKAKEETLFLEMLGKAFLRRKLKTTAERVPSALAPVA